MTGLRQAVRPLALQVRIDLNGKQQQKRRGGRATGVGLTSRLNALLACAAMVAAVGSVSASTPPEKPATSMRDMRDYFASCFQPPSLAANTRVTFYFSLNARGGFIGVPRTTWLGFNGAEKERRQDLSSFASAFGKCLPVALSRQMAATIPGEVFFLQYIVSANGRDDQVLLRPFGSHGGLDAGAPSSLRPGFAGAPEPDSRQPAIRSFPPFRPQPGRGPVFDPPIALPFHGGRSGVSR